VVKKCVFGHLIVLASFMFVANFSVGVVAVLNTLPNPRIKATAVTLGSFVILMRV